MVERRMHRILLLLSSDLNSDHAVVPFLGPTPRRDLVHHYRSTFAPQLAEEVDGCVVCGDVLPIREHVQRRLSEIPNTNRVTLRHLLDNEHGASPPNQEGTHSCVQTTPRS